MKKNALRYLLLGLAVIIGCTKPSNGPNNTTPASPSGLTAMGLSTTKVKLTWSDNSSTEDGYKIERKTGTGNFSVVGSVGPNITNYIDSGLNPNTIYTYRVFSFITAGGSSTYTNQVSINTGSSTPPSPNDTTSICLQVWMTKNLDVAYYSNGDPIPQVVDSVQWANLKTGAWCYYQNDPANGTVYGKLYNWYAINDPRGLAPVGWHIPSMPEYQTMRDCLAGKAVAGGKMKEVGTSHWNSPNAGATNSSGFTALPAGSRYYSGALGKVVFGSIGLKGHWYTSTSFTNSSGLFISDVWLTYNGSDIKEEIVASNMNSFYNSGYSVRCIKGPSILTTVTTNSVNAIGPISATTGGYVLNDGGYPVTSRGVTWSTSPDPTVSLTSKTLDGSGLGAFSSTITGLSPNTIYYVRAYATNIIGTAYGNQDTITTSNYTTPIVSTSSVTLITQTTGMCGGTVINTGANPVSSRGVVWNTIPSPTISLLTRTYDGTGPGLFTSNITGLTGNTTYYVRAYATNSAGTAYGPEIAFTTVTDPSIAICNQVWMTKNLEVTTYRNGDPIPQVTDSTQWVNLTTGAWCYFNNDPAMGAIYGKLYNWYAINDSRGLAPTGWHVPTKVEWGSLISCLNTAGSNCLGASLSTLYSSTAKLQSVGTIEAGSGLWHSTSNYTATNSSGFTALPGGSRYHGGGPGGFQQALGYYAVFWTSSQDTQFPASLAGRVAMGPSASNALCVNGETKASGVYIRCVR